MKIALICPSNILYMPYIQYYTKIFDSLNVNYDVINWDRFSIEDICKRVYRDSKIGHHRNLKDYYRYGKFVSNYLEEKSYDRLIIFGIQMAFILKKKLIKYYSNRFILDIRDHNKVMRFFNLKEVIKHSNFTVISSPGFLDWLPKCNKCVVNHNTDILKIDELKILNNINMKKNYYNLSYIGSLRDYDINIRLINSLKFSNKLYLEYHGDGLINKDLKDYSISNEIKNVTITGRYYKTDEEVLYNNSDFINVLIPTRDKNSKTLLPNRLYKAVKYGKPIITFNGTYTAKVVSKYRLGIVVNSFDSIETTILEYITNFNPVEFNQNRNIFINDVLVENLEFVSKTINFSKSNGK